MLLALRAANRASIGSEGLKTIAILVEKKAQGLKSLRENGKRNSRSLHFASLRSELVTFLIWPVVCGWKARKSICQQASPGFLRQAQDRLFDYAP
jgi:hypothetical protein